MNNSDERKIQYFIALCDDLISCRFLVAESKIQKLLIALSETQPIYELVSDCMEVFNRDREMAKAFVTDGKGHFWCTLPQDEAKFIALVFSTLVDIDQKKIDFTDFIKRFFDDQSDVNCYTSFARRMILPFRELIAEAFGLPKRYNTESPASPVGPIVAQQTAFLPEEEPPITEEPRAEEIEEGENENEEEEYSNLKFFANVKELAADMIVELESISKNSREIDSVWFILTQLVRAADAEDFGLVKALAIGAKNSGKIKKIKFYMQELFDNIEEYQENNLD